VDLIVAGVVGGFVGTAVMDSVNRLLAGAGFLIPVDVRMIGRAAHGWSRGRFRHDHPSELESGAHDLMYGYLAHYLIGVSLALGYVVGWDSLLGGPVSPWWAPAYGVATTVAAYFLLFPSIGLGVGGMRSAAGLKLPLSSMANHLFYGVGLAGAIAVLQALPATA